MFSLDKPAFDRAIDAHDRALAQAGLTIWLGAEPTFTNRWSEAPEWLYQAEGGDKAKRALEMLGRLGQGRFLPLVLRTLGRQYPGEPRPRWSFGLYESRESRAIWAGPPDPTMGGASSLRSILESYPEKLAQGFTARGFKCLCFRPGDASHWRLVLRLDGLDPPRPELDGRLLRPSLHTGPIPADGLSDPLAAEGIFLIHFKYEADGEDHREDVPSGYLPTLELPAFSSVSVFLTCLREIGEVATDQGLGGLILTGYPPPVDASVAWTTLTPDPAVVEVNMAPATKACEFFDAVLAICRAADAQGLSPYRFHYNGDVADSGGGGQITFGGPAAETSPFFLRPWLLPNVIRYFNRHPSLSYFFTPTCVGSSSQSPRPDEGFRESFEELRLALALLSGKDELSPSVLWESLAPFLRDASGNNHRSEINIEKLWNTLLGGRGCQGLVEFRAFRMARSPELLTARAVLFRALLAMLARAPNTTDLIDWGAELHDRFALPFYLKRDLHGVLDDLTEAGLGLGQPLLDLLLDDSEKVLGRVDLGDSRLTVQRALEFWPLLGDVASQESGNSRLVDSSTARIQVSLRLQSRDEIRHWRVAAGAWRVPVRLEQDREGPMLLFALRYRSFSPWRGLHPTLSSQAPIRFTLQYAPTLQTWNIALYEWQPQGAPYPGLPADWTDSELRRQERLVVEGISDAGPLQLYDSPPMATTPYCLDLRACPIPTSLASKDSPRAALRPPSVGPETRAGLD